MMPVQNFGNTAKYSSITGILLHYIQHRSIYTIDTSVIFEEIKEIVSNLPLLRSLSYFNKAVENKLQRFAKLS